MAPSSSVLPSGGNFGFTTQKVPNKNKTKQAARQIWKRILAIFQKD
jgi:hypothetical protein